MDMYAPCLQLYVRLYIAAYRTGKCLAFLQYYTTAAQQSQGHLCGSGTSLNNHKLHRETSMLHSMFDLHRRSGE